MKRWFVIHTKPRQEGVAEENLRNQGYEVYLPRISVPRRRRGRWQSTVEPLFPRYLFIELEPGRDNMAPIRSTKGVSGLVRFGNDPTPLPAGFVDYLRGHEDSATGAHLPDRPQFVPGDRVRVLSGPFEGVEGIFREPRGENRVLVLIDILGKPSPMAIDGDHLIGAG